MVVQSLDNYNEDNIQFISKDIILMYLFLVKPLILIYYLIFLESYLL